MKEIELLQKEEELKTKAKKNPKYKKKLEKFLEKKSEKISEIYNDSRDKKWTDMVLTDLSKVKKGKDDNDGFKRQEDGGLISDKRLASYQ